MPVTAGEPFTIAVDDGVLADLRERLKHARLPAPSPNPAWADGTDDQFLRELLDRWAAFDWKAQEKRLNAFTHRRFDVGGQRIHAICQPGIGPHPLPLLLTHGWPSTSFEYLKLIPLLTDPGAHGADPDDAFDVIAPDLPGYGFSDAPAAGTSSEDIADLWARLMTMAVGQRAFGAHGTDMGARVTTRLARRHPERLIGIHLSATALPVPPRPWSAAEATYAKAVARWQEAESAYMHLHNTKPQTAGCALNDSPAGLAAWLGEKLHAWSHHSDNVLGGGDPDWILTTLTLYWATATITSTLRHYAEDHRHSQPLNANSPLTTPTGFALFPHEHAPLPNPPRELAERYYTITRWRELPHGGHFPAVEEPHLLAEELRAFFRPLRAQGDR